MKGRPNIVFILTDDHAAHALSCYGSRINQTPNLDRIARDGMRFDNCFCTNSICAPSRATILTGLYNHKNGVRTLSDSMDNSRQTFPKLLQAAGYQTAIVGKWHLGHGPKHDPTGFDYWSVLPGHGAYHDPVLIEMGERKTFPGYVTDILTDLSLEWLSSRDKSKPFLLMCHHKAPHRPWEPDEKHAQMYDDVDIPEPVTFHDDYSRSRAAAGAIMRVDRDLQKVDLKEDPPEHLTPEQRKNWAYQRYIKDYLRCVASVDDNVGRLLDYLEAEGLKENTIVVYSSDQGFFLGDHGWYDKRFMYEESLRMPFLIQYPPEIAAGSVAKQMALNVDFAQTLLDYAGVTPEEPMQGSSLRPVLNGVTPAGWQTAMYYRYWLHMRQHGVPAHYGIRTEKYKLIYYYGHPQDASGALPEPTAPEWELFNLEKDPYEMNNLYASPEYALVAKELTEQMILLKHKVEDWD